MLSFISNRNLSRAAVVAGMVAGMVAASVAYGQEEQRRERPRHPDVIEHIEFPGGTLESFVAHLQAEREGVFMNVLYRNGAQSVEVPAIELKNVHFITAINVMILDTPIQFHMIQTGGLGSEVNVFTGKEQATSTAAALAAARITEVLSVGDLFSSGTTQMDDLLRAIDVAVFDGRQPKPSPEIRFHERSGLLIVRGTASQVRIASDVVERLSTRTLDQRDRERHLASERIEREAEIVELSVELQGLRNTLELGSEQLRDAVVRQNMSVGGAQDVLIATHGVASVELELRKVENRLRAAEAQLALLDQEGKASRSERTYEFGTISGATDKLRAALAAISKLQGPKIDAKQTEGDLAVTATKEQHAVVAAVIDAMKAAAAQDPH